MKEYLKLALLNNMSRIRPQTSFETTLSSALTSSANTMSVATAPTETSGYLVVEPGTSNKEIVKYTGVSGTTITGVTRGLALTGSSDSAGTGKAHPAGVKVSMTNVHYYMEQLVDKNETENVGGIKKFTAKELWIGDGTDTNESIYASNGDANKPFVRYSSADNKWLISNDGTNTIDISAGGSGLTSTGAIETKSSVLDLVPGLIIMWSDAVAPSGFLVCDGTAVSRTTYADLFDAIGEIYGAGDGSTTFNLPNMKGRVPVGLSDTDSEFDTIGETGGEKTHTLTSAEIPAHTHAQTLGRNTSGGSYYGAVAVASASNNVTTDGGTGGEGAHNNIQPYITINYIIKY